MWKVGEKDRAIVVGVSRYPALTDLQGPENDAIAFAEWLKAPDGGAVPDNHVEVILSSSFEPLSDDPLSAEPTTVRLEHAFDELHELGVHSSGRAGHRLYIFMAGHGFAPNIDDAALLMANAAKGRTGHHIPGRLYANWFRTAAFFDEVVLFMDCCRENYPRAPLRGPPYESLTTSRIARHFYGLATEYSRAARERRLGDTDEVHGLFSAALLAGLRGGARRHGSVTGSSLEAFVFNYLRQLGDGTEDQEPRFDYDRQHDIVFAGTPAPVYRVRVTVREQDDGEAVQLLDGTLQPLPGQQTAPDRWEWDLSPGLYKVGMAGRGERVLELIGEERTVDVEL